MNSVSAILGDSDSSSPLREKFLKWQCRTRQMMMRDNGGRPDDAIMPDVVLPGESEPLGAVITILNKAPGHSVTTELRHMARKTHDPAQIRNQALQFFSATYYQKHQEFLDILTATFPPGSPGAARIRGAGNCRLLFDAYAQRFDIACKVWHLAAHNPLHEATMAHNRLFNPALSAEAVILGFEPDWKNSSATPA